MAPTSAIDRRVFLSCNSGGSGARARERRIQHLDQVLTAVRVRLTLVQPHELFDAVGGKEGKAPGSAGGWLVDGGPYLPPFLFTDDHGVQLPPPPDESVTGNPLALTCPFSLTTYR